MSMRTRDSHALLACAQKFVKCSQFQNSCTGSIMVGLNTFVEHATGNAVVAAGPCRAKDPVQRMRRALHEGTQGGLTREPRVVLPHAALFVLLREYVRCLNHGGPGNV